MPFVGNQFQDLYIEYLEQRSANFLSLDKIEVSFQYSKDFCLYQKGQNVVMNFNVIVGNSDMKSQENVKKIIFSLNFIKKYKQKACKLLLTKGIKHLCILNGGIQSVCLDAPEILKYKGKTTPLSFFKKKSENI